MTFPAAALPEQVRRRYRVGALAVVVLLVVVPVSAAGTGTSLLLAAVIAACASPAVWQAGMLPTSYDIDGETIVVRRKHLPDSRFRVVGDAERGEAAPPPQSPTSGPLYAEEPRELRRLEPGRRVYRALTDRRCAVRIPIRGGMLVVSPADPDQFVRTAGVLR